MKVNKIEPQQIYSNIILDSVADGVFTVDENMKITSFNKAAEEITGIKKEDAIDQYCFEVLRASICEKACALKCSLKTGKRTIDKHVTILRSDGKEIPVSISTSILKNEKGKYVGGVESFRDLSTIEELRKEIKKSYTFEDIVSKNHKILEIFDTLPIIAQSESTVLIQGASGTGKELFARAVHKLSGRKDKPFVAINCGALPETLLESELFGYVKGAFTDAKKDKPGRFALAKGGSLFLDEVESLPMSVQVKLLRVLQEREFEPLGGTTSIKADVRVIAATKEDLSKLVKKNKFRDDLFYRLNVVKIQLLPLVRRREDIPLLVNYFIERFNKRMGKPITNIASDVMEVLMQYDYPGNIRELENIIEHCCVMCQGKEIQIKHLPPELPLKGKEVLTEVSAGYLPPFQDAERKLILNTLEKNDWSKLKTAEDLNLHRATLYRKMKKYKLV
ncbi:MAG: sigma 54-interacting transcriptional regulator [Ignavibacteriaceae bacterium]|nr:sigma 54-interacting transcriptional regulator [Ignavibacteriaceae bacterium]